ncbi:MAG TPA: hypothetical protein VHC18_25660 [Amycolatopsis sp.]|nr:hypothetical protein [Amycolatopsis sp.]
MSVFLVAVCGYVLAVILLVAGQRLSRGDRRLRRRTGVGLRIASGVVTTVTTTSWLLPAALSGGVVGGVFMFVFLFVFVPFVVIYVTRLLGRLRKRRGGEPIWPAVLIGAFALVFLLPSAKVVADGLIHLTGLAQPAELTVMGVFRAHSLTRGGLEGIKGTYVLDGVTHQVSWSAWTSPSPLPHTGEVIPVTISRLWPTMVIESDFAAWMVVAFGSVGVLAGSLLMAMALREKKRATAETTTGP